MDDVVRGDFVRVATKIMDEGACRWLIKTATKNYWRVGTWYDLDDLLADGLLCFCKVKSRYPDAVDVPHVMTLFKTTYMNYVHDLATRRTKSVKQILESDLTAPSDESDVGTSMSEYVACPNSGLVEMRAVLAGAPAVVTAVLALFADDTIHRVRSLTRPKAGTQAKPARETLNERFCRLLKLDCDVDVVGPLRAFLTGGDAPLTVSISRQADARTVVVERLSRGKKYVRTEIIHRNAAICERRSGYVPVDQALRSRSRPVLRLPAVAG